MTDPRGPQAHPDAALQELIDERLEGEERAAVERHLENCPRCRRLRDSLLASRRLLRTAPVEASPADLVALLRGVTQEDAPTAPVRERRAGARSPGGRWAALAAAAALLLVAVGLVLRTRGAPSGAIDDLLALHAGARPAWSETTPAALEARFAEALPSPIRVLDLAAMQLRLEGGGTAEVAGSRAGWMLYRDAGGERLLCAMWSGRLEELPAADERHAGGAFTFLVFRRGPRTVVAWQEGEIVCALAGAGDPASVLALARAKAMLPAAV